MLVPKKLTIKAFGRFVETQVIDFTRFGGLTQLEAVNNNTGGSSGSGKTTVARALEYNLGINDLSASVLQSRLTKEGIYTLGEYEEDGTTVIVERGKSKFSVKVGDTLTEGSSKLTEEALDKVIGMPRDLFRKILHKRQGEGGFFLDMGPSDIHKFLTSCLSLQNEQSKIAVLDLRLEALQKDHNIYTHRVSENQKGLEATKESIVILGAPPTQEIDPEAIERLKEDHLNKVSGYNLLKAIHKKEMEELDATRPAVESVPFDRSIIDQLESQIADIAKENTGLDKLEQQRREGIKSKIAVLQIMIRDLNSAETLRQSEVKSQIGSVKEEISKLERDERERQVALKFLIGSNDAVQSDQKSLIAQGDRATAEAVSLAAELNKIRASLCPTCEQGWVNDAAKTKESDILAKLQVCKKSIIDSRAAQKKLETLEQNKAALELDAVPKPIPGIVLLLDKAKQLAMDLYPRELPEIGQLTAQIQALESELLSQGNEHVTKLIENNNKIEACKNQLALQKSNEKEHQFKENAKTQAIVVNHALKQTRLREKQEELLTFANNEANKADIEVKNAEYKLKSFKETEANFKSSLAKLSAQYESYFKLVEESEAKYQNVKEEIELATESKKAIKSYLSCSFEDALDSIGDMATRLIRSIPNMQSATVQFEGLKETKEGKIKEEVTCVISMDGEIGIPVKSLSGGERSSTDLAIDLAVIKFIEERTGKGIDLFILDEPFTGLDTCSISEAVEVLKEWSVGKKLVVVDHNPILAQSLSDKIWVIRDKEKSRIEQ